MQVPSSQHSTATSWAETTGHRSWQAATQDSHLVFPQCSRETTKPQSPLTPSLHAQWQVPTNSLFQLLHLTMKFCTFLLFCFFGMYHIWSLLIWKACHILQLENLCLYWEGRVWESMIRTSTFMYGIFYSLVSCCTHIKKHSVCFITYFWTFPKTHMRQTELVTFSLKKY